MISVAWAIVILLIGSVIAALCGYRLGGRHLLRGLLALQQIKNGRLPGRAELLAEGESPSPGTVH